jgi:uncharacterized protein
MVHLITKAKDIMTLIPVSFNKIMQSRSYTVIVLSTDQKKFAIYTDSSIGKMLQLHLTESEKKRPMTHDLLNMILLGLNAEILKIVINDLQDTVYFAKLFIRQQLKGEMQILEIDARPSDCIALAILNETPLFCTQEVLDRTIAVEE